MEISDFREEAIKLGDLKNADEEYTLYYDETNNPRTVKLSKGSFNHDVKDFFILGGFVFKKDNQPTEQEIDLLLIKLDVKENMKEIKFNHVKQKSKTFWELVRKKRVNTFIDWVYANGYLVHYFYRDNYYYSLVDIIDSMEECYFYGQDFMQELKTTLYEFSLTDKDRFLEILSDYDYPNIKDEEYFCNSLIEWIEFVNVKEDFNLEYIRQSLKMAKKKGLVFLTDNKDEVTIEGFYDMYFSRFSVLINSKHIFDEELRVQEQLTPILPITNRGKEIHNYRFVNSEEEKLIQLSDVMLGILRMFFRYIEESSAENLCLDFLSLDDNDKLILHKIHSILNNSIKENEIFKQRSVSNAFERKLNLFLEWQHFN